MRKVIEMQRQTEWNIDESADLSPKSWWYFSVVGSR